MLLYLAALLVGLGILAWAADRFVDGAAALAGNLGVSTLVIGLVVIGFGTSAPELLVSATAALSGKPGIAFGNALGSNISNITLVAGATALMRSLPVASHVIRREFPVLAVATVVGLLLLLDGYVGVVDGVLLLLLLFASLGYLLRCSRADASCGEGVASEPPTMPTRRAVLWSVVGLAGLMGGSNLLVYGARNIAYELGIDPLVVGLTVVAIGTSLPELAAAVASARRGDTNLVIGNVVGSNLFNNLGVLGIPGVLAPGPLPEGVLSRDYPILILVTGLFIWRSMSPRGAGRITRREGVFLLALFFGYQLLLGWVTGTSE